MRKKVQLSFVILAFVLISLSILAATRIYYNSASNNQVKNLDQLNTQQPSFDSGEPKLENQTSNGLVHNFIKANLVTALGISEVTNTSSIPRKFNRLHIEGSVTNTGPDTAMNAGLHVEAYSADGTLEINMTYPLTYGAFGSDDSMNSYVISFDPFTPILLKSLEFGSLANGQTASVNMDVYHRGSLTNWIITPVYTNST